MSLLEFLADLATDVELMSAFRSAPHSVLTARHLSEEEQRLILSGDPIALRWAVAAAAEAGAPDVMPPHHPAPDEYPKPPAEPPDVFPKPPGQPPGGPPAPDVMPPHHPAPDVFPKPPGQPPGGPPMP